MIAAVLAVAAAAFTGPAASADHLPDHASPVGEAHTHGPDGLDLDRRGRQRPGAPAATYSVDDHAAWTAQDYDGKAFTADQPDLTSLPTVHAIYLYPSNAPSRFADFAAMFQADAAQASALLDSLYGRGVRFDMRTGSPTGGNPDGIFLDITAVRSKYKAGQLAGGRQFSLVRDELAAKFSEPDKKYVVWLDAGSKYCGQGELYQHTVRSGANYNDRRTTAIVYRPYPTGDASTGGFCRGRTLLHELGHNFGALQDDAPNAFDGAHCDDSAEDVMCYTDSEQFTSDGSKFDYLNNDYWDPPAGPLPWWTVNLSRFVCTTSNCSGFNLIT
ncbi:MAG: hypothetical protein KY450_14440 [Actinobacteria bacterium]|nr:hypothetical protein [Actinomycetota bacterium]